MSTHVRSSKRLYILYDYFAFQSEMNLKVVTLDMVVNLHTEPDADI